MINKFKTFILCCKIVVCTALLKDCSDANGLGNGADVFCLPNSYDPNDPPYDYQSNSKAIEVTAKFELIKVYGINDFDETIDLVVKVYLRWPDTRIVGKFSHAEYQNLDVSELKDLWIPKLSIEGQMAISNNDLIKPDANFNILYNPDNKDYPVTLFYEFNASVPR